MAAHSLFGNALLVDNEHGVLLGGGLALLSDGQSRSEIVVKDPESGQEERLVFRGGNRWIPVFHLIQVIRELYQSDELEFQTTTAAPCEVCGGMGLYEDDEGNWKDCRVCVL